MSKLEIYFTTVKQLRPVAAAKPINDQVAFLRALVRVQVYDGQKFNIFFETGYENHFFFLVIQGGLGCGLLANVAARVERSNYNVRIGKMRLPL